MCPFKRGTIVLFYFRKDMCILGKVLIAAILAAMESMGLRSTESKGIKEKCAYSGFRQLGTFDCRIDLHCSALSLATEFGLSGQGIPPLLQPLLSQVARDGLPKGMAVPPRPNLLGTDFPPG